MDPRATLGHVKLLAFLLMASPALAAPQPLVQPTVELLDPGLEPRAALRLTPAVGHRERVDYSSDVHTTMDLSAWPRDKVTERHIEYRLNLAVESAADGVIAFSFEVEGVQRVRKDGRKEETLGGGRLAGRRGLLRVTDRGIPLTADFDPLDDYDDDDDELHFALRDSARRLLTPFPEEPMGLGAQWQAVEVREFGPLTLVIVTDYTLVSLNRDSVSVAATLRSRAEGSSVDLRREGQSADAELTHLDTSGNAAFVQPLSGLSQTDRTAGSTFVVDMKVKKGLLRLGVGLTIQGASVVNVVD